MGLKTFHIVFIVVSTLLCAFLGAWSIQRFSADGDVGGLAIGIGSLAAAVVLVVYGVWFLRKLKHVSFQ